MNTLQNRLDKIEIQNQNNQFKHSIEKITRRGCKVINIVPFHFKKFEFKKVMHIIYDLFYFYHNRNL